MTTFKSSIEILMNLKTEETKGKNKKEKKPKQEKLDSFYGDLKVKFQFIRRFLIPSYLS